MIDPTGHEVHGPDLEPPEEDIKSEEIQEESVSSNVCDLCLGDNLLKNVGIAECERCKLPFCIHFASKIDQQYCVDCMSDITVTKTDFTYHRDVYNEQTDKTTRYSRKARSIKIAGQDWLFAQRKISQLSEAELAMVMEYHRTMFQLLMAESEARKVAQMHRNSNVKINSPSATVTTTTTVKRTTETKSTKESAQLQAILLGMLGKGMSLDQIAGMLKGKK